MRDPFAEIARFYDWEHVGYQEDLALYRNFAERAGGPVLELACGTGRLLVPLALHGLRVSGVDASEAMLAAARARLAEAGIGPERADVHRADLVSFALPVRYAMAFIALDSFGLLLHRDDQLAALRATHGHLVSGGLCLIDVSNGNLRAGQASQELQHQLTAPLAPHGRLLTKFVSVQTDPADQVDRYIYFYDESQQDGGVKRTTTSLSVRYFGRFELELLLECAGFVVEALYGSYALDPYGPTSERLIAVARKP